MPFKLKPQLPGQDFSWIRANYHMTYKGFIPVSLIMATVSQVTSTPLVGWSVVHEEGEDDDDDEREAYQHTHVALIFTKRLNLVGADKFDVYLYHPDGVEIVHPHVAARCTMSHMEEIFTQYHAGRKYNLKTGKTEFKAPVMHEYKLPQDFEFSHAIMVGMLEADNLIDACLAGNVRARTVNDVKTLRTDASKRPKQFEHKFPSDSFFNLITFNLWTTLHIYGDSNTGKTKWAVAQFKNPLLVKPFNSIGQLERLKHFDPSFHDGIVLDEACLKFLSREECIALVDFDEEATFQVRFTSITIPASVKMIIVSNPHPDLLYPKDDFGAIRRRIVTLGPIKTPTYKSALQVDPATAAALPPLPPVWPAPAATPHHTTPDTTPATAPAAAPSNLQHARNAAANAAVAAGWGPLFMP